MVVEKKKYIIELPENTHWIQWIMESTKDHHPYMNYKQVEDLTPYTEPDIDAIRKEAYAEGYKEGMQLNIDDAKLKEEYRRGLNDAWDVARKIRDMTWKEQREVFGTDIYTDIIVLSASECIEKIRQYEQKKGEIEVGDEITAPKGLRGVCIGFYGSKMYVMWRDGSAGLWSTEQFKKTGRHLKEIGKVLEKMREE